MPDKEELELLLEQNEYNHDLLQLHEPPTNKGDEETDE
jgi:hypothetical protein